MLCPLDWNQKSPHFKYTAYLFLHSSSFTVAALLQHHGGEKVVTGNTAAELGKWRKQADYSLVAGVRCG